jgi:GTP-binding protein
VHLVDMSSETGRDPVEDFEIIRRELKSYSPDVFAKPQITVANKMDALDEPDRLKQLEAHLKKKKLPLLKISGATGDGVDKLLEAMWKAIARPAARVRRGRSLDRPVDRSADRPAKAAAPTTGEGSVDLLTPARSRRRGA